MTNKLVEIVPETDRDVCMHSVPNTDIDHAPQIVTTDYVNDATAPYKILQTC